MYQQCQNAYYKQEYYAGHCLFIYLLIHSFINLFIHFPSFIHLFTHLHLFIYLFIHFHSFIHSMSFIHLFIYLFIHSFIHSPTFIYLFIYSFIFTHSFIHSLSFIYLFIHSFIHPLSFIYSFIHSFTFIYLFIHLFIHHFHLFIHSFIFTHSFIHSCTFIYLFGKPNNTRKVTFYCTHHQTHSGFWTLTFQLYHLISKIWVRTCWHKMRCNWITCQYMRWLQHVTKLRKRTHTGFWYKNWTKKIAWKMWT
jgi:hypothetical protein